MKTLKILGCLLVYPEAELLSACSEMRHILSQEKWLPAKTLKEIDKLLFWMEESDLLDLQENYVDLFDRTPSLSLHLFEHIHGDSRERGSALVDLMALYEEKNLFIDTPETPDYLPLFLEYLTILPLEEARENLGATIDVIAAIGARLKQRGSQYAVVFEALEAAANKKPDPKAIEKVLKEDPGTMPTAEEIDAAWEEQFAFETPPTGEDAGCPRARDMLARMEQEKESV